MTTYDAKDPDTAYPPIEPLRPPESAPNVLVILVDDAGFGSSSAFGDGRVDATVPMAFSADETTDVGSDSGTPVTDDFGPAETEFSGRVRWVEIDLGGDAEDADHLITAEERMRVAMARQ